MKSVLSLLTIGSVAAWHVEYDTYAQAYRKTKSLEREKIFLESLERIKTHNEKNLSWKAVRTHFDSQDFFTYLRKVQM